MTTVNVILILSIALLLWSRIRGLKDWDPCFRFSNLYFLGIIIQPIAIWTVEAFRKRNLLTAVSM
jgi:hypothetical protein